MTFIAETMAIMNARPLIPISSDHECMCFTTKYLTQKFTGQIDDFSYFDLSDVYFKQWKFVQVTANKFWTKWKQEYV